MIFCTSGSTEEREDLKTAYITGKGNMDYICDHVQFARSDQEDRLREILNVSICYDKIVVILFYYGHFE